MTKKFGVGQAHSKIILIGEHAVVYGYPAISLPLLEVEVTCKVIPAASPWRLYEEDTLSMAVYASLEYWISKKPAFAVRLTRLSLKNGEWVRQLLSA